MNLDSTGRAAGTEGAGESKYGKEWSQGFFGAAVISLIVWSPLYLAVDDNWPEAWWFNYAIAFIVAAGFVTLAWITCALAEYLERRNRKREGPK